jgi:3beta-hydroxysteroid-4beta-carboxylate 3-dehydrogenase (decarboxylating)
MVDLVTGATGHLGANLVRQLLSEGRAVRVLLRQDDPAVDGLDVQRCFGDLRDAAAVSRAVAGCERVYHCAARVSTSRRGARETYACNVVGTRNVLAAARQTGVARVVVTGSFSAVGRDPERPSDETIPFQPFDAATPYEVSKAFVEQECLRAAVEGLDVVIAVSTAILGPNDFKPSRLGRVLIDFARGKLRAYIPGGFEFVAARDIVAGHRLAMERGRSGQKYIFSSEFLSVDDLMSIYESVTGRPRPWLRLPPPMMASIAASMDVGARLFPRWEPRFTPAAVRHLRSCRRADCRKARTELGFVPTPVADAAREAYAWFRERGEIA